MNLWMVLFLLLFLFVLYLNFLEEMKINHELEILEMDYIHNDYLQEICRVKQPVYFQMKNGIVLADSHYLCTFDLTQFSNKYGKQKIDMFESPTKFTNLRLEDACSLFTGSDPDREETAQIWSENNSELIMETPLKRYFSYCDAFLAPFGTAYTEYDFILGSVTTTIPLRYHQRHSYFIYVIQGEITVKLTAYKKNNTLIKTIINDYTYPDEEDPQKELEENNFVDAVVPTGYCISIPPYWWHSIHFNMDTQLAVFIYDNLMNMTITQTSAVAPKLLLHF